MAGHLGSFSVVTPNRYVMTIADHGVTFDLDRTRRERHELWGELIVTCTLKGAKTIDGVLVASDFNVSGQTSRSTRAKLLAERAPAQDIDWVRLTEEFCQRVIHFDRSGQEAPKLKDIPTVAAADGWTVDGIRLLQRHPMVLFGDGGQGKSLVALYLVSQLAARGIRVLYCDWEFDGESHRERYEALHGAAMPETIRYARCDRSLALEADRLRRLVQQDGIQYLVCDSIVFACGPGVPPESAEAASTYYQALRQIGVGSLNLAHTTKQGSDADEKRQQAKPFGSVFWSNGARSTWFLKGVPELGGLNITLTPRKANTGPLGAPVGWQVAFDQGRIRFGEIDGTIRAAPSLRERLVGAVQMGSKSYDELADELQEKPELIRTEVWRGKSVFSKVTDIQGVTRIQLTGNN